MCGIAGILHRGARPDAPERARRMAHSIRHRGPDDEGYWHDADIALGFVRLSIVDLEGGHQPMCNEDGTVWVVFNGEIYNHPELRRELQALGHHFKSDHADTETLVHGWEAWGDRLPERLNGMFAFAIWDARGSSLFLARDRYGIKPLYTASTTAGDLVFASEIRAIHASGLVESRADHDGIIEYFSQQNPYRGNTLFAGVGEFPAASCELVTPARTSRRKYWDLRFNRRSRLSLEAAAAEHREILERVVQRQIAADVPVMAYLSGGIDSSALVSAAHRYDPRVKAYSCLFDLAGVGEDRIVDERDFSRAVARSLDIEHVELELQPDALAHNLDATIRALETPRMGMSYVNYLIAGRVARDSKVVLSGTGGDELHGGYVYRYQAMAPGPARTRPPGFLRRLFGAAPETIPASPRAIYTDMLNFPIHRSQLQNAFTPGFLGTINAYDPEAAIRREIEECADADPLDMVMHVDARNYLHGLLVMEDKLSMAHSLEARVPLWTTSSSTSSPRCHGTCCSTARPARSSSANRCGRGFPTSFTAKPKMGFGPPDASWYRSTLRPFIEHTLSPRNVEARGVFKPEVRRQDAG
jgi:asparagine synthase (glutamine-hydrolysing)